MTLLMSDIKNVQILHAFINDPKVANVVTISYFTGVLMLFSMRMLQGQGNTLHHLILIFFKKLP